MLLATPEGEAKRVQKPFQSCQLNDLNELIQQPLSACSTMGETDHSEISRWFPLQCLYKSNIPNQAVLRENHAVQVAAGASWIRLMDPKELNARQSPSMEKVVAEGFHYFIEWACYAVDLLQFFATTLLKQGIYLQCHQRFCFKLDIFFL